jgi:DNA sulfur modification protein DndB
MRRRLPTSPRTDLSCLSRCFLTTTQTRLGVDSSTSDRAGEVVLAFWKAIAEVLPEQWANTRKHVLNKGVGVYALMDVAAELYNEVSDPPRVDRRYFVNALSDFVSLVDWTTDGPFKGLGGEGGVPPAVEYIKEVRRRARLKVVQNG